MHCDANPYLRYEDHPEQVIGMFILRLVVDLREATHLLSHLVESLLKAECAL